MRFAWPKATHGGQHHAFGVLWVATMLAFAALAPGAYVDAMQEDRLVEWSTAVIFGIAAAIHLRAAYLFRRFGDGLVGLFCLVVAGEEISWGQRILGFMPPAAFLEHNAQQELTFHNLADFFGQPKWVLAAVLLLYGVLLPASQLSTAMGTFVRRVGLTVPPFHLITWFALCSALLVWYPVEFTGEWVELLASTLFLATGEQRGVRLWGAVGGGVVVAGILTLVTGAKRSGPGAIACARQETQALLHDLTIGRAVNASLAEFDEVDRRMLSAADDGYFDFPLLQTFNRVACSELSDANADKRRRHVVDPWGTAYWLRTRRDGARSVSLEVYSFGPNRRRDGELSRAEQGDDIVASGRYDPDS